MNTYRGYAGSKNGGVRTLGGTTTLLAVGMYSTSYPVITSIHLKEDKEKRKITQKC